MGGGDGLEVEECDCGLIKTNAHNNFDKDRKLQLQQIEVKE